MSSQNTQLTNSSEFKPENVVFGNLLKGNIPNTSIGFHRIPISYKNPDGSIGDLVIPTEYITSFGVEEETEMGPEKKPKGTFKYTLALWNMNGPTEAERQWTDTVMSFAERCKSYIAEQGATDDDFPYPVNDSDLEDMVIRIIYWGKRDNKKKLKEPESKKPYISPKLIHKFVDGEKQVITQFYDEDGNDIDFRQLIGKRINTCAAVKFEGIFCKKGMFSIQVKLLEAEVKFIDTGFKRLLRPQKVVKQDISEISVPSSSTQVEEDDSTDSSSGEEEAQEEGEAISESEEEEQEPEPAPEPVKKGRGRAAKK